MDLARSEAMPADQASTVSLENSVRSAVDRIAPDFAARDLRVHEDGCPSAIVTGNQTLLSRMVENLIENAVRHNERSGWIRVYTEVDGSTARLIVENSGPVLDDASLQVLMQPFRRLGAERTASEAGFGLGLSIVASIAQSHGGSVQLQPIPDGGLRATVSLPLATREPAGAVQ